LPDFQYAGHITARATFEYPAGLWDQVFIDFLNILNKKNFPGKYQNLLPSLLWFLHSSNLLAYLLYGANFLDFFLVRQKIITGKVLNFLKIFLGKNVLKFFW